MELLDKQGKVNDNLTRRQCYGIMELENNPNLVIEESNKGGACVVMDAEFDNTKMLEMVNDNTTYKELDTNIDRKIHKKIINLTEKYHEELRQKEVDYLTKIKYKTSQLY